MNSFFRENDQDRRDALLVAQDNHPDKLPAYIIEKDFYVTCILRILYMEIAPKFRHLTQCPFVFKGGTSLSKCCNLINRMSEDIDLSFSMELLGVSEVLKTPGKSRKQMKREADTIEAKARDFASVELIGALTISLQNLDERIEVNIENKEPLHIGIHYPTVIMEGNAVQRRVLLETGSLAQNNPVGEVKISHMLGDLIPSFSEEKFAVDYLMPERTMVEKIFGVHCNLMNGTKRNKYARHLYDILKLHERDENWCVNNKLLIDHVDFCSIHYRTNEDYCNAVRIGPLLIVPSEKDMLNHYREDWEKMADMFPYSNLPYSFDELIKGIQEIQDYINKTFYN